MFAVHLHQKHLLWKLQPTPEQADALRRTLLRANEACNAISQTAWDTQTLKQFPLHRLVYEQVREQLSISAQLTVRCIAKVADAYKKNKKVKRTFRLDGAVAYDDRILSFNLKASSVSIWTLDGRLLIPFVCGERQRQLLATRRGESDLTFVRGNWYLFTVCDVETPEPIAVAGVLGVDLGVTNIATDSDGTIYSGKAVKNVRYRHRNLRRKLQAKGTKGSRRRLKRLAGKEQRFAKHVNHTISKQIVATAQRTTQAIALEDLTHIRTRVRVRKSQRATLASWSFQQLQGFVTYKAQLVGVPVYFVDPRNTSRTCPMCGFCAKENHTTQASFVCLSCGHAGLADKIAAVNISRRALVPAPHCSDAGRNTQQRQGKATPL